MGLLMADQAPTETNWCIVGQHIFFSSLAHPRFTVPRCWLLSRDICCIERNLITSCSRILVRSHGVKTWMSADVILAADGMNSIIRRRMAMASDHEDHLVPAGELAYRFLLPRDLIEHDKTAIDLLGKNQGMRYMGPNGHISK